MKKLIVLLMVLWISTVCFGAADHIHVLMPDAAGDDSGDDWANAMSFSEFETDLEGSAEAGDRYYIKDNGATEYDLTGDVDSSARSGTAIAPIYIIGVKAGTTNEGAAIVASDYSYAGDRPIIDGDDAAYDFHVGAHYIIRNLDFKTQDSFGVYTGADCVIENCRIENTSANANYQIIQTAAGTRVISCELYGAGTRGVAPVGGSVINCYIHDCDKGIHITATSYIIGNIIDTTTTGIDCISTDRSIVIGNTLYACATGVASTDGNANLFINNIIDGSTTEANWATANQLNNWWDYNSWDASPTHTNVTQGENAIETNTTLTDPTGSPGDFTLASGDTHLEGVGLMPYISGQIDIGVAQVDYDINVGVDQDDISASGGNPRHGTKNGGKQ